jgi:hypothetical protein
MPVSGVALSCPVVPPPRALQTDTPHAAIVCAARTTATPSTE